MRDSQQPTYPIGFLSLKLPPPPGAALLVSNIYFLETLVWYWVHSGVFFAGVEYHYFVTIVWSFKRQPLARPKNEEMASVGKT
jgi:hypothetical protein